MTGKWRVYNDHPMGYTHKEKFKGDDIEIKAGEFILMDYEDAIQFKSQFFPIRLNAQNVQDPVSYKVLRVVADSNNQSSTPINENKIYVSPVDGKEFTSKEELEKYLEANFSHLRVKDEAAEETIKSKASPKRG